MQLVEVRASGSDVTSQVSSEVELPDLDSRLLMRPSLCV